MNSRARFPELDLLRFIAACGVMLYHYTYVGPRNHLSTVSYPFLSHIFKYGFLGVDVFFILSGFVILLTAYEKDAIAFTLARMVRLYPAYWICVTLTAAVIVLTRSLPATTITPFQYFANLTMVHGFFGIRNVSGVYWTLAIEIQFYFLIFLVLLIGQVRRIRYALGVWLLASIILSFCRPHGVLHFFLLPEWSSYFIAGAMLFLIHREGASPYKLCVVGICYLLSVAHVVKLLPLGTSPLEADLSAPVIASALAVSYITFLFIAMRPQSESGSNPFYILGLITYPLYLLHQDIGYILLRSAPKGMNPLLLLAVVMAAMIAFAWLVHVGPEKWLTLRLKSLLSQNLAERWQRKLNQIGRAIRAVVHGRISPVPLASEPLQPSAANSQGANSQSTHVTLPPTVPNTSPTSPNVT